MSPMPIVSLLFITREHGRPSLCPCNAFTLSCIDSNLGKSIHLCHSADVILSITMDEVMWNTPFPKVMVRKLERSYNCHSRTYPYL